ncbi:hypothetical protein JQ633_21415 [Bradyrhizobium tropiciagri]|uniref:hypothetical protein n=1 Tax=Bradyrhizobium tropiciagri TaxID=312253 RepID=UPI001BAD2E69|nr:hypothetical protein [Bradyrhizobium tropiciagri]MBR0872934.1 hypothetical protein [Bradyrhizobium tropiciagri]
MSAGDVSRREHEEKNFNMKAARLCFALCLSAGVLPAAQALTLDEIRAKLTAAGYSQIREVPSGKIKTFKATKDGTERSVIVDSTGHYREVR